MNFLTLHFFTQVCVMFLLNSATTMSVCLSQVGVLIKRHKQHLMIEQILQFSDAKDHKIRPGSSPVGAPNAGGIG